MDQAAQLRDKPRSGAELQALVKQWLRGGSWNNNERNARLPERNNNHPNNNWNNNGVRVVVFHRLVRASSAS